MLLHILIHLKKRLRFKYALDFDNMVTFVLSPNELFHYYHLMLFAIHTLLNIIF